jgi:hypothetical protein
LSVTKGSEVLIVRKGRSFVLDPALPGLQPLLQIASLPPVVLGLLGAARWGGFIRFGRSAIAGSIARLGGGGTILVQRFRTSFGTLACCSLRTILCYWSAPGLILSRDESLEIIAR